MKYVVITVVLLLIYLAGFFFYYQPDFKEQLGVQVWIQHRKFVVVVPYYDEGLGLGDVSDSKVMAIIYWPILKLYGLRYTHTILNI